MDKLKMYLSFILKNTSAIVLGLFLLVSCASENEDVVTDIDGNEYKTVKIGNQWWMAENLRVTHYHDGSAIPNIPDGEEWSSLDTGAFCTYENDPGYALTHGLLYNWYAATDNRGICPDGWHVPSDEDWMELEIHLGMVDSDVNRIEWRGTDEGGKLKETGIENWQDPNTNATNETGFSARPGGGRAGYSTYGGNFYYGYTKATYWTSTENDAEEATLRELENDKSGIFRFSIHKRNGFSIRCIKD